MIPTKINYGLFFKLDKINSIISLDLEQIDEVDQAVSFESGYYSNYLAIQKKKQSIYKAGLEVTVIDNSKTNVKWRIGTYDDRDLIIIQIVVI